MARELSPRKKVPVTDGITIGLGYVFIVVDIYRGDVRQGVTTGLSVLGIRLVRKIIATHLLRFIRYLRKLNKEIEEKEKQLKWIQKLYGTQIKV